MRQDGTHHNHEVDEKHHKHLLALLHSVCYQLDRRIGATQRVVRSRGDKKEHADTPIGWLKRRLSIARQTNGWAFNLELGPISGQFESPEHAKKAEKSEVHAFAATAISSSCREILTCRRAGEEISGTIFQSDQETE